MRKKHFMYKGECITPPAEERVLIRDFLMIGGVLLAGSEVTEANCRRGVSSRSFSLKTKILNYQINPFREIANFANTLN